MIIRKTRLALTAFLAATTSAFYLPGVAPTSYESGDPVPLLVNRLTPAVSDRDDQLHNAFSFDYYHHAFNFCRPKGEPKYVSESLGSILFGDRIMTSPYELKMVQNDSCKALCEAQTFNPRAAKFVNKRIVQNYNLNFLVDGLPAGMPWLDRATDTQFVMRGFQLGYVAENGLSYINNHYDIMVDYHEFSKDKYRVVGVMVNPTSRKDNKRHDDGKADCGETPFSSETHPNGDTSKMVRLNEEVDTSVTWTYSVIWRPSKTAWATRWDSYLHVYDPKIHWFSLVNSAVIVLFLCGMVSAILARTLKKDIARYNRLDQYNLDDLSATKTATQKTAFKKIPAGSSCTAMCSVLLKTPWSSPSSLATAHKSLLWLAPPSSSLSSDSSPPRTAAPWQQS